MARGRAPGFESQRDEIVRHAAQLFARKGYTGTSMNEVAEACAVSKPTLYHYVRDKYELLVLIAEGHVTRLAHLIEEVDVVPRSPEERLRALITRFVREYSEAQHHHRVLTEDVKFLNEEDQTRVLDLERRVVTAFANAVAAVRPELLAAQLHKPLTMLLFGMINWMFTWLKPEGELTYDAMAPMVADLFFGGIGAVKAEPATAELA
ncbi:MAG: TetR family transcriptional regulator [Burkholderiaceae bacterium]|nr:TetR family transcriptional regulator [Burkholderiaceae bacterium]MBT9503261.1 TetR family transcriptional regulator [Burkholderiaceae bacterium]